MDLKKVLIFLSVLLNISCAYSQRGFQNLKDYDYDPYHFGFLLGVNQMGFSIKQDLSQFNIPIDATQFNGLTGQMDTLLSVEPKSTTGFTIGIVANLRISDHFDLRFIPSLSFGERTLIYTYNMPNLNSGRLLVAEPMSLKSTMLEFPLNLKYKGNRINNARPYVIGGLKYAMDLSSDAKKADNQAGDYSDKLKQTDLYGELGAGFDLYFDWFKMGIEAKMSYGLRDIIVRDTPSIYNTSVSRMGSKIFQLSFTFE